MRTPLPFIRLIAAGLAIAGLAAAPSTATAAEPAGTVVLVHGAFADGSSWAKVISRLRAHNLDAIAVQLPLTSLAHDVAATRRAIARAIGPVTLVGHSWGGAVITEAGTDDRVKALVYVAAFAPAEQTSVHALADAHPAPGLAQTMADADGFVRLTAQGVAESFAPQATPAEQALIYATQAPIRGASFGATLTQAASHTKPSWFVIADQDRMILPALQHEMAKCISAHVTTVAGDHVVALTHSEEVAAPIIVATIGK